MTSKPPKTQGKPSPSSPPPTTPKPKAGSSKQQQQSSENGALDYGAIAIALVVVLLTIVWIYRRVFGKKKGRSILIVGPSDAGKTAIFVQVWQDRNVDTVTSVVANEGDYSPSNGRPDVVLKDLPGNDRVRQKFWESNKAGVRGIICVIDAAGGSKSIRDGADVLYNILTDPLVAKVRPNVLIFANKQDLPTAKGIRVIRASLEREITTLRLTKSATLQTTEGNVSSSKMLGRPDKDFDFDQLLPLKVEFAEGTGNSTDTSALKSIIEWLDKTA